MNDQETVCENASEAGEDRVERQTIFLVVGAVVTRLRSMHSGSESRQCEVVTYLADEPINYDTDPTVRIDMTKCYDFNGGDLSRTEIDGVGVKLDGTKMGYRSKRTEGIIASSLGQAWPEEDGPIAGQLLLEASFVRDHIGSINHPPHVWPPSDSRVPSPGQYVQVRYSETKRYVGFSGYLREPIVSGAATVAVEIWHPLQEGMHRFVLPWAEIDENVPVKPAGFSIGPILTQATAANQWVSLFLSYGEALRRWGANGTRLMTPKLPFWMS